jgi:hypothetical protein
MGRAICVYVYTSDETGACVHELARRIVAHVGEERVNVRVAMHGDGAGLVEKLTKELAPLTIDVAHGAAESAVAGARRLMVEVSVAGGLSDATFHLHIVEKRVVITEVRTVLTVHVDPELLSTPEKQDKIKKDVARDVASQLLVLVTDVEVKEVTRMRSIDLAASEGAGLDNVAEVEMVVVIQAKPESLDRVVDEAASMQQVAGNPVSGVSVHAGASTPTVQPLPIYAFVGAEFQQVAVANREVALAVMTGNVQLELLTRRTLLVLRRRRHRHRGRASQCGCIHVQARCEERLWSRIGQGADTRVCSASKT